METHNPRVHKFAVNKFNNRPRKRFGLNLLMKIMNLSPKQSQKKETLPEVSYHS